MTNSNTYVYEKPFVGQKKVVKQKMEGGKSFVAPPSGKQGDWKEK